MSAIGGMVNWNFETVDTRALFDMSRAMILRAPNHRDAYVRGNLALLQNHSRSGEMRMPQTMIREGRRYTVVLDGNPSFSPIGEEMFESFLDLGSPETLLDAYLSLRETLADAMSGPFAIAIVDEERAELYLGRDADGARPLFYREEEGVLYFASEIKGLLPTLRSAIRIDAGRLRTHLISPYGVCFGEDLYRDIESLPAGHSAILSRLGLRVFRNEPPAPSDPQGSFDFSCAEIVFPKEAELDRMLTEVLYAFDYPQFDYLMPTLFCALRARRERGMPRSLRFEDPSLCMNLRYARERADRIGSVRGVLLTPVAPRAFFAKERELRRLERTMRSLLGSVDSALLRYLLGDRWSEILLREKNTAKRNPTTTSPTSLEWAASSG